jgi:hypothetical protein
MDSMKEANRIAIEAVCRKIEANSKQSDLKLEAIILMIKNADEKVVNAKTDMERRLHGMNDLQSSLDKARAENASHIGELVTKFNTHENWLVKLDTNQTGNMTRLGSIEGRKEGEGKGVHTVMMFVALLISLLNTFYLVFHAVK